MGFIKFLLISILVIYLIGLLGRYLLRSWLVRKQKEFSEQLGGQGGYTYKQYTWGSQKQGSTKGQPRKKEGEVHLEGTGAAPKKVNRNVGDYVEYEEVTEIEYEETK